jgi:hypothetical protein
MHLLSCYNCTNSCVLTDSLYLSGDCASLISKGDRIIMSAHYEQRCWFSDKFSAVKYGEKLGIVPV